MTESARTTPITVKRVTAQRATAREAAVAALEGFHWLLERVAIYPPGHPVVQQARDRTWRVFSQALESGSLRIEAGRGSLRLASRRIDSARCRSLGSSLAELDIVSLEVHQGVTADEILDLARRLGQAKASGGAAAARADFAGQAGSSSLQIGFLDYAALRVDEGAQEPEAGPEPGEDPERIWNALSDTILGSPGSAQTLAPEQLANLLGDEIVRFESVGSEVLSGQLERLLADVELLDPDARREAQARIGRFLTALPRALREELLRIDPTLSRSQPLRPDSIVTALLLGAVQGGDRPPEDAVALLNQLLRSSTGEDERVRDLLERVSAGEAGPEELDSLSAAVRELFSRREDIQANPEDYQALIDCLASSGVRAAAMADRWTDQFDDPRDAERNRAHAVEIAAEQFRDRGAATHAGNVLAYLGESVDTLIDIGCVTILEDTVRAVEEFAASKETDDDLRGAANAWIASTVELPRLERILATASRDETAVKPALALARRAGPDVIDAILPVLAAGPPRALAEPLYDILAAVPAERILMHARNRIEGGWASLRPLFPVLCRMEGKAVQDFLMDLLEHPEENVRSHALGALNDQSLGSEHVSDILFSLLQDPSPRIVRAAIRKLGSMTGQESVDLLGDFVRGRLMRASAAAPLELRLLAVRVLTLRGAPGWDRLEWCLARLGWRLRRDDVEIACEIASALERRSPGPGTARTLRRWRWSPARRLATLLRRERRKKVQW